MALIMERPTGQARIATKFTAPFHVHCPFCGTPCDKTATMTWCSGCLTEWYTRQRRGTTQYVFDPAKRTERFAWAKALTAAGGVRMGTVREKPAEQQPLFEVMQKEAEEHRPHTCHAIGCKVECEPRFLMCPKHWSMVPDDIQHAVWKHFNPLQCQDVEDRPRPTGKWMVAAEMAVVEVALKEEKITEAQAARLLEQAREYQRREEASHEEEEESVRIRKKKPQQPPVVSKRVESPSNSPPSKKLKEGQVWRELYDYGSAAKQEGFVQPTLKVTHWDASYVYGVRSPSGRKTRIRRVLPDGGPSGYELVG